MNFSEDVLQHEERAIFRLRTMYSGFGYIHYRMNRFEEYDLYVRNKNFLASDDIITFNDASGRLLALRPDVTLSIVKNTKDEETPRKLYYNENVYRPSGTAHEFKERMQVGLEHIGAIDLSAMAEVIVLADRSLATIGARHSLGISHLGFLCGVLDSQPLTERQRSGILACISEKNVPELRRICAEGGLCAEFEDGLARLASLYGTFPEVLDTLKTLSVSDKTDAAVEELAGIYARAAELGVSGRLYLDFSIVNDMSYYSGLIFQGYVDGIPAAVLSGGRYDHLMRRFGKKSGAIGFAVYLDLLERLEEEHRPDAGGNAPRQMLNIALPKGRLGEDVYEVFEKIGYGCPAIREPGRKLVFENPEVGVRYFWVKPSDVAIYVERGAADIGVAGKDILLEYAPDVYELADLGIGRCRMAVAAQKGFTADPERTLRVATKFTKIARDYYTREGREIDIIKLNGSIELAPILGLSDVIVDIVESGKTLQENNLEATETIVEISARLISNKVSFNFKNREIEALRAKIAQALEAKP